MSKLWQRYAEQYTQRRDRIALQQLQGDAQRVDDNETISREQERQRRGKYMTTPEQLGRVSAALDGCVPIEGTPGEAYLRGRGVTPSSDVLYDPNFFAGVEKNDGSVAVGVGPSVVFRLRDQEGQVIAVQARIIAANGVRMLSVGNVSQAVFSTPGALDADVLAVCEAPIDALSLAECGLPALALCGAQNRPLWLRAALSNREVVLATDSDAAGDAAASRLSALLRASAVRLWMPAECKDANEALQKRPAELRAEIDTALDAVHNPLQRSWRNVWRERMGCEPPVTIKYSGWYGETGATLFRLALESVERSGVHAGKPVQALNVEATRTEDDRRKALSQNGHAQSRGMSR